LINADLFFILEACRGQRIVQGHKRINFQSRPLLGNLERQAKMAIHPTRIRAPIKEAPKEKKSASSSLPPTDDTQSSSPQAEVIECNDEAGERLVLGNEARPEGNKTAKRKRNEDKLLEKVLKTQEELIKISKDCAESVKSAMQVASDE
jgi:hypothetical protein